MSKELTLMIKLEAAIEEADLSEKEMERVVDWFTSKYDPELNKKEPEPINPFLRETVELPGLLQPQQIYPVITTPFTFPQTSDPPPWQTYQTWCSDHSGGCWADATVLYTGS